MADFRAALGHALEPAYRVEREVRPVGNCRMFVALEKSAGGGLLVKVLPGALSLAVDSTRFEQEIARLGRRLRHPSLVAPRNAGGVGSFVYHTRTFVEGTTLRAWLARHGELPLRRAVEVLRDVLTALAHAHADGLAHGDLKPENVLLADGQALVADTGILGALVPALTGDGGGAATAALCAADYLAPERRAGQPAPATRDDMVAVGVLELGVTRVASSIFARQMTTLARAGWKTLTLDQFAERLRPGYSALRTPHSAFLLTFDDGYASLAEHVYPILADVGFTATTFLITDHVGRLNTWDVRYTWHRLGHLDWDTIGRWQARGFDFASHTASHQRLTWLSDAQAGAELEGSRETLRHRLGPEAARAVDRKSVV